MRRKDIDELIAPTLTDLGFELVQVRLIGATPPTLQIMAEPVDRARPMTVEDCALISHAISAVLDVADPVQGAYRLEVSSPGIERPLVRPRDFERFAGLEARLETEAPIAGRRRFKGRLRGLEGEDVLIESEAGLHRLPFASVRKARLVMNDELLAQAGARGLG
jgi:ribosome maturation factor RimP